MNDHTAENTPAAAPATRPLRGAARCAEAALVLAGVAWTARAVWQIRLAVAGEPSSGPPDQGNGNHRTLTSMEDAYHVVSALGDIATGLCALVFLAWLVRARDNARALSGERPRYSWPWVYLGWIVPVVNLWVPRGIVADVYRTSAPDKPLPRALNWWWGLWLAGMLSGVGLMYAESTDEVIARAYTDIWQLLLSDTVVVAAAVAGVLVVRAVTAAQTVRAYGAARRDTVPAA